MNDEREKEDTAKNRRRARKDWRLVAIKNEWRNLFLYNFTKKEKVAEKIRADAREDVIVRREQPIRLFCSFLLAFVAYRFVSLNRYRYWYYVLNCCTFEFVGTIEANESTLFISKHDSLYWRESLAVHDRRTKSNLITVGK